MITHVLDEAKSPAEALVYTMWCGEQFVVVDDGSSTPEGMNFYLEREAQKADCAECLKKLLGRVERKSELVRSE